MSNSLKERILFEIGNALCIFSIMGLVYCVLLHQDDWFAFCTVWTICWVIGDFSGKAVGKKYSFLLDLATIFITLMATIIILFFVNMPLIVVGKTLFWTVLPFGSALLVNHLVESID